MNNKIPCGGFYLDDTLGVNESGQLSIKGGTPYQQLVTDGNGNTRWEDKMVVDSALSDTSTNPVQNKVIKSALDSLSEEIVNLPQPDWNQNDDTQLDYVKNRPFYTGDPVETVLVEESTVTFEEGGGLYEAEFPSTFEATAGDTYKVTWDGTVYECTCVDLDETLVLGNLSVVGAGSDTGEPFVMSVINGEGIWLITTDSSTSHTFSISGMVAPVVKIDKRYLPSAIPFMEDGKIPEKYLPEKFPDVRDVFGGVLIKSVKSSTLANPYPNKTILGSLTVEAFNVLLNDLRHGTRYVMVDNNVALVQGSNSDETIRVSWSDSSLYSSSGKPVAGAKLVVYEAKIHEDTDNPGTIISECAAVSLADKALT